MTRNTYREERETSSGQVCFLVDTVKGELIDDDILKDSVCVKKQPYGEWLSDNLDHSSERLTRFRIVAVEAVQLMKKAIRLHESIWIYSYEEV